MDNRIFIKCGDDTYCIGVERLANNPIIYPGLSRCIGENINGPSLIRVPPWVDNPLGRYYLYFAHHSGDSIRLAYSDDLEGPWSIYEPATLHLNSVVPFGFAHHVASPDVDVDNEKQEIRMYFHAPFSKYNRQMTGLAVSKDGITFEVSSKEPLGPFYFRVFKWDGYYYAIAKNANISGQLLRSRDGTTPFEKLCDIIPNMRHGAVLIRENTLFLLYTVVGHAPERILVSTIKLTGSWKDWDISEPVEVLRPELEYEGCDCPLVPSSFGPVYDRANQLRDPAVFEEDGKVYMLYSVAGESGIAIARLHIEKFV